MEKIVTYYRVSTDKQGKSGLGLEAQRTAVERCLDGARVVAEFTEVETGKRSDRPELDKALAAARLHRATLVVAKLDRLSRNVAFLSRLIETGVDFRCADLPQIEGATGRFLLHQMAAVAELEAGMISARTKAALAAAKARGTKLGGRRYRDGEIVNLSSMARQRAAEAVQRRSNILASDVGPTIKALQAGGAASARAIANGLNAAGIPTARGAGPWTHGQVNRVLARIQPNS